jgi:hypothetical protein
VSNRRLVTSVLLALACALVAAGGVGAGGAEFADPPGDSGTAADVTEVGVFNTARDDVIVAMRLPNRPTLEGTASSVYIDFDTDRNVETGEDGSDYLIVVDGKTFSYDFAKWNGTQWESIATDEILVMHETGVLSVAFNVSLIGGSKHFDFWISTYENDDFEGDHDFAPDGDAVYTFELTPPKIVAASARYSALSPKAGKRFSVKEVLAELDDTSSAKPAFTCRATLAGKALKPVGKCAWAIPRNAKGKKLVVYVTATNAGGSFALTARSFTVT